MNDIRKVIASEWLKLERRRSTYIIPLLVMAIAAGVFETFRFAALRQWIGEPTGFHLAAATMGWVANVAALYAIIFTSFHVAREFDLGTVKSAWVRPLSRQSWFTGKVASACIMTGGLFLAVMLLVLILAGARSGYADLFEKDFLVHSAAILALRFAETMALLLLALLSITTVAAAIASCCGHPAASIAAAIGLNILFGMLGVFPSIRPILLSTAFGAPVEQLIAMTKGLPTPLPWGTLAWRTIACAGGWFIVAFLAGSARIRRMEIGN